MKKLLINKKANTEWLFPWMILNWVIIIGALIIVSYWFFSQLGDIRVKEAGALNEKISTCLSASFSAEEFNSNSFDIFTKCDINRKLFDEQKLYYLGLTLNDSSGKQIKNLDLGTNWRTECLYQLDSGKTETIFPGGFSSIVYLTDVKTKATYSIKIIAGSNQK